MLTQPRPIPSAAEILSGLESGESIPPMRIKPAVAEYYTGRPKYVKLLIDLEDATRQCRRGLESVYVLKPNDTAPSQSEVAALVGLPAGGRRGAKVATNSMWLSNEKMSAQLNTKLKASQYKMVLNALTTLAKYAPLASFYLGKAGASDHNLRLVDRVSALLDQYRKDTSANASGASFFTSKTGVDEEGRIWAKGGRKESKALVYLAPCDAAADAPLGQIKVNNHAMAEYFSQIKHREDILHPLRLTHLLGQFNVFALATGGGLMGQSGAVAHGIAKAVVRFYEEGEAKTIAALEENQDAGAEARLVGEKRSATKLANAMRRLLAKDGVLKRDPRMVERKKTGLAKARKAYTWVKR